MGRTIYKKAALLEGERPIISNLLDSEFAVYSAFLGYGPDHTKVDELSVEEVEFVASQYLHPKDCVQQVYDLCDGEYDPGYTVLAVVYQYGASDTHVVYKDDHVPPGAFGLRL